jgi:IclR family acetate operon transcriptional repressor
VAQEIAVALGIPVSSLSYLLGTLVERGYLARDGRRYSAGPGCSGCRRASGGFSLAERAAPLVRTLRVQLNETTSFFIRHGWEVEALVTESSEQALRYAVPTGNRLQMHALASGKALLAALSDDDLDRYFAEAERTRYTASTVVSEKALRKEIAQIRKDGFSFTDEEFSLGIVGIGRAVTIAGEPVGALSVAIPKARIDEAMRRRAMDLLERTAGLARDGLAALDRRRPLRLGWRAPRGDPLSDHHRGHVEAHRRARGHPGEPVDPTRLPRAWRNAGRDALERERCEPGVGVDQLGPVGRDQVEAERVGQRAGPLVDEVQLDPVARDTAALGLLLGRWTG